jgi:hypothetical protein
LKPKMGAALHARARRERRSETLLVETVAMEEER